MNKKPNTSTDSKSSALSGRSNASHRRTRIETRVLVVIASVVTVLIVTAFLLFFSFNSSEPQKIDQDVSAEEAAFNEAVANANPGKTFADVNQEIANLKEASSELIIGSKEWVEMQYEIVQLHRQNDDFETALELNSQALESAIQLGDAELTGLLEDQRQGIIEYQEFLEKTQ